MFQEQRCKTYCWQQEGRSALNLLYTQVETQKGNSGANHVSNIFSGNVSAEVDQDLQHRGKNKQTLDVHRKNTPMNFTPHPLHSQLRYDKV